MSATTKVGPRDGRLKSKGCLACIRQKVKVRQKQPPLIIIITAGSHNLHSLALVR